MACFVVPAGQAVATMIVQKVIEKREKKSGGEKASNTGLKWSRRLSWLNMMLWGGSLLLAFDHIWNGEVIFRPPFFTALENGGNAAIMLREIATTGIAISVFITIVWAIIVAVVELKSRSLITMKGNTAGGNE